MRNTIYILAIAISATLLLAENQEGKAAGKSSGSMAHGRFASKSSINSNMFDPAMNGSTQMTTLDGSESFDGRLMCQSRQPAVKILFLPAGEGAYRLVIEQDSDLDGTLDFAYDTNSIGGSLNGACTGGVVSGTMRYVWTNSGGKISLEPLDSVNISQLGTCYSSSSGSDAYSTIGSGVTRAINISLADPAKKILTDGKFDVATFTYTIDAILPKPCSEMDSSASNGDVDPKIYYESQTPPLYDQGDIMMKEGPGGIYGKVTNATGTTVETDSDSGETAITGRKLVSCSKTNYPKYSGSSFSVEQFNDCAQYENNPQCEVKEKNICKRGARECVSVISGGSPDNAVPSSMCESLSSTLSYCANGSSVWYLNNGNQTTVSNSSDAWIHAKYVYKCENQSAPIEPAKPNNTMHTASLGTTDNGENTLYYKDFQNSERTADLPDSETCLIKRCMVKRASATSQPQGPTIYESDYKECTQSGENWICNLGAAEELVEDCACEPGDEGMTSTLGTLWGIEQAAKDMVCSTLN